MDGSDLTSLTSIFIVLGFVFAGIVAALFYYFLRFTFKDEAPKAQVPPEPMAAEPFNIYDGTQNRIWGRIRGIFQASLSEQEAFEQMEEILLTSDLGPKTVGRLTASLDEQLSNADKKDPERIRMALRHELTRLLTLVEGETKSPNIKNLISDRPSVLMIVGVNGAGKTTTIGKLAQQFAEQGYKTMVAAGDTFRAAAQSQLGVWAERAGVELFSPPGVTDPAAVAFEALTIAKKKNMDVVIIDTAGRLHTQTHLMEELKKIKRVMAKIDPKAPHKTLLVLDASTGQNALLQAKMFHEALQVDGVILTKMDGTAKGGVVVGLSYELKLPIFFIGVGETAHDLKPFNSVEFVNGILGLEKSVVSR